MKRILIALLMAALLIGVAECEAREPYDVIHDEVIQFNRSEKESSWIAMAILYAADECKMDPMLITAVMEAESAFNFKALSPVGAIGLMQIMPATAKSIGVDPYNPLANVVGGAFYLKMQLDRFAGQSQALIYAVAAYNAGPEAVAKAGGIPAFNETRIYVVKVLNNYNRLHRILAG